MFFSAWGFGHEDDALDIRMGKEEALTQVAFPDADRIERRTLFLEPEQREALSRQARSRFHSRLHTVYVGYVDGAISGYAVIDTGVVRSKAATYIAVMNTRGELADMRILAWQEPPEYQPPQRWLDHLLGRRLERDDTLRVGHDVDGISGATLSVRMLTEHARRTLALYRVMLHGEAGNSFAQR